MDKYIFDESNSLWYELQGDYYIPCLILSEEKTQPIGLWGQRHKEYLKEHKQFIYTTMLIEGTLNRYLADINQQAEKPWEWIGLMNNIQACAREVVNCELIYV